MLDSEMNFSKNKRENLSCKNREHKRSKNFSRLLNLRKRQGLNLPDFNIWNLKMTFIIKKYKFKIKHKMRPLRIKFSISLILILLNQMNICYSNSKDMSQDQLVLSRKIPGQSLVVAQNHRVKSPILIIRHQNLWK